MEQDTPEKVIVSVLLFPTLGSMRFNSARGKVFTYRVIVVIYMDGMDLSAYRSLVVVSLEVIANLSKGFDSWS